MKFLATALFFASCLSQASENISSLYLKKLADEVAVTKTFQQDFKESPRRFCPKYNGADESTCFKIFLQNNPVKSSAQVMIMTGIASTVGGNDSNPANSQQMARILMLENVIVLFESLNLSQFHLSEIQALTESGKTELKFLRNSDEQVLAGSFKKVDAILLQGFASLEKKRSVASVEDWKKKKLGELKTRLEKLRKNSWKYPG